MALSFLFAVLTVVFSPGHSFAEEQTLSFREALSLALDGNPELRAVQRASLAAKEDIGIAGSYVLPRITLEERYLRTNNPTYAFMSKLNQGRFAQGDFAITSLNNPDPVNDFQASLIIEQPLFALKARIGIEMARKESLAREEELARKREEVVYRVLIAALDLQSARAYAGAAGKGVEDAKEQLRIAEARYAAGTGLYADVLRAQVSLSVAEERQITAEKNLQVARRALGLVLGLDREADISHPIDPPSLRGLDFYLSAMRSRKDLVAFDVRRQNAYNGLKMAQAGIMPTFGIGGTYQMNHHTSPFGQEGESWQMSAVFRWELFEGLRTQHEKEKAAQKIAETEEYLQGLRHQISFMVHEAYLSIDEAEKGLEIARKSVAAAEEGRRLVQKRYENSLSGMADLLDVQAQLDSARANAVAREGAYGKAVATLHFRSGTLLQELGIH